MNASQALPHALLRQWPADQRDALPLALWDAASIEAATGGRASHQFQASGVEMDSRDVRPGDLFVALKGEAMDGHKFIPAAFTKGAVAAIVDRPVDFPHVLVEDTTKATVATTPTPDPLAFTIDGPEDGLVTESDAIEVTGTLAGGTAPIATYKVTFTDNSTG